MKFFVTGTDTEIGKTTATCALISACVARGIDTIGLKPVAAGETQIDGQWVNDDVVRLMEVSNPRLSPDQVCAYQFRTPCAPELASRLEKRPIDREDLLASVHKSALMAKAVFVEGVGGFCVPLTQEWTTADLAVELGYPIILTVGIKLGCINHALLTHEAIISRGLKFSGWVANEVSIEPNFLETVQTLTTRLNVPPIATIPFDDDDMRRSRDAKIDLDKFLYS